jgi:tetratricopeptide (TPR) repeat protein
MRGRIAFAGVRYAEAERYFRQALADYARAPGVKPETVVRIDINLGLALSEMGRQDAARQAELDAVRIVHDRMGGRQLLGGQAYYVLAGADEEDGRFADAQREIDQAIDILQGVLDNDNPILADALVVRGQIETDLARPAAARTDLIRAIATYERAFKGPHYKTGAAEVYLALAESKLDQTDAALHQLVLAKANYDGSYHHLHVNHGDLLVNRARILKHAGRTAEARKDCAAGLAILRQFLKPDEAFYKTNVAICAGI